MRLKALLTLGWGERFQVPRVPPLRITIIVMQAAIKHARLRRWSWRITNIGSPWCHIKANPWDPAINKNCFILPNDLQLQVRDPTTKQFQISQPTKHFLDKNTVRLFASCRSVWKGYFRSVTDWVWLVFITDFIGLNLCSVRWTNSHDEQSQLTLWLSFLFDLLSLISSLSDFIYSPASITSNICGQWTGESWAS